jgi:hypothetical protein
MEKGNWIERAMCLKAEAKQYRDEITNRMAEISSLFLANREGCEHFKFIANVNFPGCKKTDYICQSSSCPLLGEKGRYAPPR